MNHEAELWRHIDALMGGFIILFKYYAEDADGMDADPHGLPDDPELEEKIVSAAAQAALAIGRLRLEAAGQTGLDFGDQQEAA